MAERVIRVVLEPSPALVMLAEAIERTVQRLAELPAAHATDNAIQVPPSGPWAGPLWSEERVALLRREWLAGLPVPDLLAALLALPGQTLTEKQVTNRACYLRLIRPPELGSREALSALRWTEGRIAKLRELWATECLPSVVLAQLNALPGPQLTLKQVQSHAGYLRLERPRRGRPIGAPEPAAPAPVQPDAAPEAENEPEPETAEVPVPEPEAAAPAMAPDGPVAPTSWPVEEPAAVPASSAPAAVPRAGIVDQFRQHVAAEKAKAGDMTPVEADYRTIEAWAAPRGLAPARGSMNVQAVNQKRVQLGLAPYKMTGARA